MIVGVYWLVLCHCDSVPAYYEAFSLPMDNCSSTLGWLLSVPFCHHTCLMPIWGSLVRQRNILVSLASICWCRLNSLPVDITIQLFQPGWIRDKNESQMLKYKSRQNSRKTGRQRDTFWINGRNYSDILNYSDLVHKF